MQWTGYVFCKGVARGGPSPQIASISGHYVLWEAVSQTKYCCSLKVKRFGPPKHWYFVMWYYKNAGFDADTRAIANISLMLTRWHTTVCEANVSLNEESKHIRAYECNCISPKNAQRRLARPVLFYFSDANEVTYNSLWRECQLEWRT